MSFTKSLSVEIKDADTGEVEAVFSTFDVVDKDGDVTLKDAFTDGAPVVISAYGHTSWAGDLPVGKGVIVNEDDRAVMKGQFFMDTTHGLDTFRTVKALSEAGLQEWSYSLHDVVAERGQKDGRNVRILKKVGLVKEVSPVLLGAGVGTQTLMTKAAKQTASGVHRLLTDAARERWSGDETYVWLDDWDVDESWAVFDVTTDGEAARLVRVDFTRSDDAVELGEAETDVQRTTTYAPKSGERFVEQASSVLADVERLATRATEVVALRAVKGKQLSDESGDLLTRLDAALDRLKSVVAAPSSRTPSDDETREFLRFVATQQGVTIS